MLNARLRKRFRQGNFPIGLIGEAAELRYEYAYLGAGTDTLADLVAGNGSFLDVLKNAKRR